MNELRAAEACCFFDLKIASDQRGVVADPLSSGEFEYTMGCSSEDDDVVEAAAATGKLQTDSSDEFVVKVTRNRFRLLLSDDDGCSD